MKRLISLLAVLACLLAAFAAPFASADDTAADAAQLPDHIVNGDFEYQHDWFREHAAYGWTAVIPSTGLNWNDRTKSYQPGPDDWNEARFGWHSTQADGTNGEPGEQRVGAVELQGLTRGNALAEIVAAQPDTSIYQDIHVTPGNTYHWSLKHQSSFANHVDRMQVLIGEPGRETPQQATRTKTNGGADGTGDVGTDIATANITDKDSRNWETYEGNWTCPEGVTVARFTFKSVDSLAPNRGNLVDDIGFSQSTTLRYDPNGGTGMMADQTVGVGVNRLYGHGWLHVRGSWPRLVEHEVRRHRRLLQTRRHDRHRQADDFVRAMDRHHADGDAGDGRNIDQSEPDDDPGGGLPSGPHTNPVGKTAQAPVGQSRKAV